MARCGSLLAALTVSCLSATGLTQSDDDIVTFTVCSTWDCLDGVGIDQKFEIWANKTSTQGREMMRLGAEQLAAMERYPDW